MPRSSESVTFNGFSALSLSDRCRNTDAPVGFPPLSGPEITNRVSQSTNRQGDTYKTNRAHPWHKSCYLSGFVHFAEEETDQ
jgi:hypothetical protein